MRRLKSRILSSGRPTGLQSLLDRRVVCYELSKLVDGLGRGEKETIKQIEKVLKQFGLSVDDIDAHTLLKTLDPLERIDRTISHAESRRNNAVREIEKSRDATARRMRMALSEEDASPSSFEVQETSA